MDIKPRTMIRAAVGFVLYLFLNPLVLFVAAGTTDWPMAWMYVGLSLAAVLVSRLIAAKLHPDMLKERARFTESEGMEPRDRFLVIFVGLLGPLLSSLVAGLDHNFQWGVTVPGTAQVIAAIIFAAGCVVSVWAMVVNQFFSSVIRIQKERGHSVVTGGPYRLVRHPSYASAIWSYLAFPFMVDALWALIPAVLLIIVLIIRTALEDRTLHQELPGYEEYAQKTRYRLFPGIW
jgi:protein-S-isoprenylcysteine O-methyltransferase Ste14